MSSTPDDPMHPRGEADRLKTEFDRNHVEFLRVDLALCFTFTSVAETEASMGEWEAAERLLSRAELGRATISHFLSDPKHANRISREEREELTAGLQRLRATLDGMRGRTRSGNDSGG